MKEKLFIDVFKVNPKTVASLVQDGDLDREHVREYLDRLVVEGKVGGYKLSDYLKEVDATPDMFEMPKTDKQLFCDAAYNPLVRGMNLLKHIQDIQAYLDETIELILSYRSNAQFAGGKPITKIEVAELKKLGTQMFLQLNQIKGIYNREGNNPGLIDVEK